MSQRFRSGLDPAAPAGCRTLTPENPGWPELWREMADPPESVQFTGEPGGLAGPAVAIVGTRRATPRGVALARALSAALAARGWTIVSGLALGIDAAAHRGALDVGGITVGVMGTGIDLTYPAIHRGLRREIEARGCVVTEFPPGTGPRRFHFPRRNRLIAGLVRAVVVVEAPLRSGALSTASLALDYNRDVFAVPGPVDLETSRGCHLLLRQGAYLLETAEDLHAILAPPAAKARLKNPGAGDTNIEPAARWIFDRLDFDGVPAEELHCRWPGSEEEWSEGMLSLELNGMILRLPGGRLARRIW